MKARLTQRKSLLITGLLGLVLSAFAIAVQETDPLVLASQALVRLTDCAFSVQLNLEDQAKDPFTGIYLRRDFIHKDYVNLIGDFEKTKKVLEDGFESRGWEKLDSSLLKKAAEAAHIYHEQQRRLYVNYYQNFYIDHHESEKDLKKIESLNLRVPEILAEQLNFHDEDYHARFQLWHVRGVDRRYADAAYGFSPLELVSIEQEVLKSDANNPSRTMQERKDSYAKLIQLITVRERMTNIWAVERLSNPSRVIPGDYPRCAENLSTFKRNAPINFQAALWAKDHHDELTHLIPVFSSVTYDQSIFSAEELKSWLPKFIAGWNATDLIDPTELEQFYVDYPGKTIAALETKWKKPLSKKTNEKEREYINSEADNAIYNASTILDDANFDYVADRIAAAAYNYRRQLLIKDLSTKGRKSGFIAEEMSDRDVYQKTEKLVDGFLSDKRDDYLNRLRNRIIEALQSSHSQAIIQGMRDVALSDLMKELNPRVTEAARAQYVKKKVDLYYSQHREEYHRDSQDLFMGMTPVSKIGYGPKKRYTTEIYTPEQLRVFLHRKLALWKGMKVKTSSDPHMKVMATRILDSRYAPRFLDQYFKSLTEYYHARVAQLKLKESDIRPENSPLYDLLLPVAYEVLAQVEQASIDPKVLEKLQQQALEALMVNVKLQAPMTDSLTVKADTLAAKTHQGVVVEKKEVYEGPCEQACPVVAQAEVHKVEPAKMDRYVLVKSDATAMKPVFNRAGLPIAKKEETEEQEEEKPMKRFERNELMGLMLQAFSFMNLGGPLVQKDSVVFADSHIYLDKNSNHLNPDLNPLEIEQWLSSQTHFSTVKRLGIPAGPDGQAKEGYRRNAITGEWIPPIQAGPYASKPKISDMKGELVEVNSLRDRLILSLQDQQIAAEILHEIKIAETPILQVRERAEIESNRFGDLLTQYYAEQVPAEKSSGFQPDSYIAMKSDATTRAQSLIQDPNEFKATVLNPKLNPETIRAAFKRFVGIARTGQHDLLDEACLMNPISLDENFTRVFRASKNMRSFLLSKDKELRSIDDELAHDARTWGEKVTQILDPVVEAMFVISIIALTVYFAPVVWAGLLTMTATGTFSVTVFSIGAVDAFAALGARASAQGVGGLILSFVKGKMSMALLALFFAQAAVWDYWTAIELPAELKYQISAAQNQIRDEELQLVSHENIAAFHNEISSKQISAGVMTAFNVVMIPGVVKGISHALGISVKNSLNRLGSETAEEVLSNKIRAKTLSQAIEEKGVIEGTKDYLGTKADAFRGLGGNNAIRRGVTKKEIGDLLGTKVVKAFEKDPQTLKTIYQIRAERHIDRAKRLAKIAADGGDVKWGRRMKTTLEQVGDKTIEKDKEIWTSFFKRNEEVFSSEYKYSRGIKNWIQEYAILHGFKNNKYWNLYVSKNLIKKIEKAAEGQLLLPTHENSRRIMALILPQMVEEELMSASRMFQYGDKLQYLINAGAQLEGKEIMQKFVSSFGEKEWKDQDDAIRWFLKNMKKPYLAKLTPLWFKESRDMGLIVRDFNDYQNVMQEVNQAHEYFLGILKSANPEFFKAPTAYTEDQVVVFDEDGHWVVEKMDLEMKAEFENEKFTPADVVEGDIESAPVSPDESNSPSERPAHRPARVDPRFWIELKMGEGIRGSSSH